MGCCFTKDFQSSGTKARGKGKEAGREEKPWRGHISRLVTSEHNWLLNLTASPSQKLCNYISGSLFRRRKERYYPSPHFSTVEGCHRAHHFRTGLSMGGPWAVSQGSHLLSISRKDPGQTVRAPGTTIGRGTGRFCLREFDPLPVTAPAQDWSQWNAGPGVGI